LFYSAVPGRSAGPADLGWYASLRRPEPLFGRWPAMPQPTGRRRCGRAG